MLLMFFNKGWSIIAIGQVQSTWNHLNYFFLCFRPKHHSYSSPVLLRMLRHLFEKCYCDGWDRPCLLLVSQQPLHLHSLKLWGLLPVCCLILISSRGLFFLISGATILELRSRASTGARSANRWVSLSSGIRTRNVKIRANLLLLMASYCCRVNSLS